MATIVTRSGKGSPLTNTEVDANFTNLNTGLTPIEGPSSLGSAGQVLTVNSGASASEWAAAAGADLYAANESSPSAQPSATGANAVAVGDGAQATGSDAFALGTSYANGVDSFAAAIGSTSTSLGARDANTIAIGLLANASETGAIALGRGTVSGDFYSSGLGGYNNLVNSDYATIAGGRDNIIQDASSIQRGDYSAVLGGRDNTITNNYAAAWGRENTISGFGGTAGGTYNNISGAQSFAIGYFNITGSEAYYGFAHGAFAKVTTEAGRAQASGKFTTTGDAQGGQYILRVATTNATPAVLITDPAYPTTANTLISAASDTCITFNGTIVAMQNGAQSYGSWEVKGLLVNDGGTTTLANSVITAISNTSNWGVALSANNTLNALSITVTGEASHNIRWVANIHTAEVTYA